MNKLLITLLAILAIGACVIAFMPNPIANTDIIVIE